jgi:thymidylate synthase (FAD)
VAEIKVELIDSMGSDLTCVNAARVSFDKASEFDWVYSEEGQGYIQDGSIKKSDKKLIKYLATHNHTSPFTHPQIQVRETVPIFVARQRFKHVVGFTYNEISRRYVDDVPEFFFPEEWRERAENKKQGSGGKHPLWNRGVGTGYVDEVAYFYEDALRLYNRMLEMNVAPEQARMILPQSMMTSYYVTGSLAAFARAYKLRSYPDAQKEIRDLAEQWDAIIRPLFPHSWSALVD